MKEHKQKIMKRANSALSLVLLLALGAVDYQGSHAEVVVNPEKDGRNNNNPNNNEFNVVEAGLQLIHEEQEELLWPWDGKNKSKKKDDKKNKTDDSCYGHQTCDECYSSSRVCHWCAHDNACHVMGSVYGCITGVRCASNSSKKEDNSCKAHKSCAECALSSTFCHWCAHDQQCHAVGSVYGCLSGVDCYSNDRCQRPEPVKIKMGFLDHIGTIPLIIIFSIGAILCCCATIGFGVSVGVKGAYDDLISAAGPNEMSDFSTMIPTSVAPPPLHTSTTTSTASYEALHEKETNDNDEIANPEDAVEQDALLLPTVSEEPLANPELTLDGVDDPIEPAFTASPSVFPASKRSSGYMNCLLRFCGVCYCLVVVAIGVGVYGAIWYFPKFPQYSICNDSLAWKSLVETVTNAKMQAKFEILASVQNPNHLSVSLVRGSGSFSHKGSMVGTFELPPTDSAALTITDVKVVASFTPEKWEALSLAAEYYNGNLVLDIESEATFRIPALYNYTLDVEFKHIRINVANPYLSNRKLCACPSWKDMKNKTKSQL